MEKQRPSRSAEGVALVRAIEAQKPEGERICYDPYARGLIDGSMSFILSKLVIDSGIYERMAPGRWRLLSSASGISTISSKPS